MISASRIVAPLLGAAGLWLAGSAQAVPIANGSFTTGDLSGWEASANSGTIPPIPMTPLISVVPVGGNSVARLSSGEIASGPFVSTLQQSFTVSGSQPLLGFDVFFSSTDDTSGAGSSIFGDALTVVLQVGSDFLDLVLVDELGIISDPFGTAPGSVTLGNPTNGELSARVIADLTALAGREVTLFFDITSEDDGRVSTALVDNVAFPAVPEPSILALIVISLLGVLCAKGRDHNAN